MTDAVNLVYSRRRGCTAGSPTVNHRFRCKALVPLLMIVLFAGCGSAPGGVGNKVLTDFGIREKQEGYVTGTDTVYQNLPAVGKSEVDRLNVAERRGTVKFKQDGLHGVYVKRVKRYEAAFPVDAAPISMNSQTTALTGYYGYIEFSYRYFESAPKPTSTEAQATDADIPTEEQGREQYRYSFGPSGTWDGGKGQRTNSSGARN